MNNAFCYAHTVHFYETDLMGVVHHSNFLRIFEDARVAWLKDRDLAQYHAPAADLFMAVLESDCQHQSAARLGDNLNVYLQVRMERLKTRFRYAIFTERTERLVATGSTLHIALSKEFKILRPPKVMVERIERERWTETWP